MVLNKSRTNKNAVKFLQTNRNTVKIDYNWPAKKQSYGLRKTEKYNATCCWIKVTSLIEHFICQRHCYIVVA